MDRGVHSASKHRTFGAGVCNLPPQSFRAVCAGGVLAVVGEQAVRLPHIGNTVGIARDQN